MTRYRTALLVFVFCILFNSFDAIRAGSAARTASMVSISLPGPEGGEGSEFSTTPFVFRLSRTGDLSESCTVTYETREGTAFAPEDFTPVNASITFEPGRNSAQVTVAVKGDRYREAEETFYLALVSATGGCSISGSPVIATMIDTSGGWNDGCVIGMEGDVGSYNAALRVDDLVRIRRLVLGFTDDLPPGPIPACVFQLADINGECGDGQINSADVIVLRQWILQGSVQKPTCGPTGPPI
ncbi:MAG: Calx-beta domain-containing protein [Pyrinomonadaceae bacterium]